MGRGVVACLMLVACGGGHHGGEDAALDAFDALDVYATPVTIKVVVGALETPTAHRTVYFQNADSTLVAEVMTDANGEASVAVEPGGFVTVLDAATSPNAITFTSVQPGDHLKLIAMPLSYNMKNLTITAPRSGTADHYFVHVPCGIVNGTTQILASSISTHVILMDCPSTTDLLVAALDAGDNLIESVYAPSVAVSDGGTVDLTGLSYAAPVTHSVTITGLPAGDTAQLQDIVSGTGGLLYAGMSNITANGVVNLALPPVSNATNTIRITETPNGSAEFKRYVHAVHAYAASTSVDLAASFVTDLTACPTLDHAAQTLSWSAAASGAAPNVQFLDLYSAAKNASWSTIGPATPTLQLPTLPTDVFDYHLADSAWVIEKFHIAAIPGGYDRLRQQTPWTYPMDGSILNQFGSSAALVALGPVNSGCP